MMIVNFDSNTIVFYSESAKRFISISHSYRILAFCINQKFVAVLEDWEKSAKKENLYIYDSNGRFLFNIKSSPRAMYGSGFFTSIGFESEDILLAQSNDFSFKIDLLTNEFIDEKYTK